MPRITTRPPVTVTTPTDRETSSTDSTRQKTTQVAKKSFSLIALFRAFIAYLSSKFGKENSNEEINTKRDPDLERISFAGTQCDDLERLIKELEDLSGTGDKYEASRIVNECENLTKNIGKLTENSKDIEALNRIKNRIVVLNANV